MSWIFLTLSMVGVLGFIPLSMVGIVLLVMAYSDKQNLERKKKLKKWGLLSIFVPIGITILGLIGSMIMGFVNELV